MSSPAQVRGDGLRRQIERSRAYAERHGLELDEADELFDSGKSAFTGDHIADGSLGRFLSLVDAGTVPKGSYLLVEAFDRLSRQNPTTALIQLQKVLEAGITVVTLNDDRRFHDLHDIGQLMTSVMSMFVAHEESRKRQDRVSKSWAEKRRTASTAKMTRVCPEWLNLSEDRTTFEIRADRVATIRRIYSMSESGFGVYRIVRELNHEGVPAFRKRRWAHSTVKKILQNEAVRGRLRPHKMVAGKRTPTGEVIEDYYPRIIDDATFFRVANGLAARRSNAGGRTGHKQANLFGGKLYCVKCGGKITRLNRGPPPKGGTYLACSLGYRQGIDCTKKNWRYSHFEAAVLRNCRLGLASQLRVNDEAVKSKENELDAAQGKLGEVQNRITFLDALGMKIPLDEETLQQRADAEHRRAALKADISRIQRELELAQHAGGLTEEEVSETLDALADIDGPNAELLRAKAARLFAEFVERIDVDLEGLQGFMTDEWVKRVDRDATTPETVVPLVEDDELDALLSLDDPASKGPAFAITYAGVLGGDLVQTYPGEPEQLRLRVPLRPGTWEGVNPKFYRANVFVSGKLKTLAPDATIVLKRHDLSN